MKTRNEEMRWNPIMVAVEDLGYSYSKYKRLEKKAYEGLMSHIEDYGLVTEELECYFVR